MDLTPIGVVRNGATAAVDEQWGAVESVIEVTPSFAAGLAGIETFSHAIIVFWMHQSTFDPAADVVRRPRGRADLPEIGIFAQRAKHRPNPIGVTAVRVLGREGANLRVRGLDAIDGTPVLDIKPYMPAFDRVDDATNPAWVDDIMRDYF